MKRPVGVTLTALLQILGSVFVLLLAAITMVAPRLAPSSAKQPPLPAGFFLAMGLFYVICAGIGIATAAGLLYLKNWSRYATLIFSGILAFFGLLMAVVFALIPFPPPQQSTGTPLPPNFETEAKLIMVAIALAIAALGVGWLCYFNRKGTRSVFLTEDRSDAPDARPLSITVLAVLNFLAVPTCLFCLWKASPIMVFGTFAEGIAARVLWCIFLAVALYTGVGLLRLNPASRYVAICFYLFGIVNTVLFYFIPGREERLAQLYRKSMETWRMQSPGPQQSALNAGFWGGLIGTFLFSGIAIYFLVARRSAFEPQALTLAPPSQPPVAPQ
jgi:hypothetical protein